MSTEQMMLHFTGCVIRGMTHATRGGGRWADVLIVASRTEAAQKIEASLVVKDARAIDVLQKCAVSRQPVTVTVTTDEQK